MATANITKARVDRMAEGDVLWDGEVRGFGVRRRRREASYVLKYRAGRRQRFITIGKHGSPWTPDTARKEARRLLGAIHAGNDPAVQRDRRDREPTLEAVLARYVKEYVETHNKPSTRAEAKRHVETILKPTFGKLKIGDLTKADVRNWHATFKDRPYEGNRSLAYLRKALAFASDDLELREDNPALGVKRFPETKRERFFSDAELHQIGKALAELEAKDYARLYAVKKTNGETVEVTATSQETAIALVGSADASAKLLSGHPGVIRCIRLLALTGMRLSEVVGLEWAWIDFEEGCARLPDAKAGARAVPLGGAALSYLSSLDRLTPFVCYGTQPDRPIGIKTVKRFWPVLRDRAGLKRARMHDFRHTVGTLAALTGANGFIVRDVLGHSSISTTDGYVARVTSALRKTADQVTDRISAAMSGGPSADVVSLRKSQ